MMVLINLGDGKFLLKSAYLGLHLINRHSMAIFEEGAVHGLLLGAIIVRYGVSRRNGRALRNI